MKKETKQGKYRYFVTAPSKKDSGFWIDDVYASPSLSSAFKNFAWEKARGGYGGAQIVLAREMGYEVVPDEENLSIKVVPVNDIDNGLPYYLIERFMGTYDTYGGKFTGPCHRTNEYKEWKDIRDALLSKTDEVILTKGLEAKLEE